MSKIEQIVHLQKKYDELTKALAKIHIDIVPVLDEHKRMKEALQPFYLWGKRRAEKFGWNDPDNMVIYVSEGIEITVGDLKRVKEAMESIR